ncbi:MAG: NRDE family protein [Candidatus Competibacteraceae bacterium]
MCRHHQLPRTRPGVDERAVARSSGQRLPARFDAGGRVSRTLAATSQSLQRFQPVAGRCGGFVLLLNRADAPQRLPPGWYGLSNHLLDTPWPKLKRGYRCYAAHWRVASIQCRTICSVCSWTARRAPDPELPSTVSLEWERWLSSIFIDAPSYGTRSSTLLLADDRGQARMLETTWLDGGRREYLLDWPVVASSA